VSITDKCRLSKKSLKASPQMRTSL